MEPRQNIETKGEELQPTFAIALRVWWAWTWRALLIGMGIGLVFGFFGGILGALLGIDQNIAQICITLASLPIGVVVGVIILAKVLKMRFKNFRIALLPINDQELGN